MPKFRQVVAGAILIGGAAVTLAGGFDDDVNCKRSTSTEVVSGVGSESLKQSDSTTNSSGTDKDGPNSGTETGSATETASVEPTETTKTTKTSECGGVDVNMLVPFGVVALLLLLPDVSEFAIPGVLSAKVKAQEKKIEDQGQRQEQLAHTIQSVQTQVTSSVAQLSNQIATQHVAQQATQQVQVVFLRDAESRIEEKAPLLSGDAPLPGNGAETSLVVAQDADNTEFAVAVQQLLELAEPLRIARRTGELDGSLPADRLAVLQRWRNLFGDEVETVLAVRNSVAHGQRPASVQDLQEVISIARRLNELLDEALTGDPGG